MDADADTTYPAGDDRLSRLGDGALGHILSFLPAAEAARAAALSRWRHVFPAVHTLAFSEAERPFSIGFEWFRHWDDHGQPCDPEEVRAPLFVTGVGAALLGRDRGPRAPAAAAPIRALRVVFDEFGFLGGDTRKAVDGWLSYAAYHAAADGLQIDLRLDDEPLCTRAYALLSPGAEDDVQELVVACAMDTDPGGPQMDVDDDDEPPTPPHRRHDPTEYVPPKILFSPCAALRALRLCRCRLKLPSCAVALPCLEAMHLTRASGAIERLVSSCPRLADLTLEACGNLTKLSVLGTRRLRRLALRCCHKLAAVEVDAVELRGFEYRGAVPPQPQFLTLHGEPHKISVCTIDLCGEEPATTPELAALMRFLRLFAGVERLNLTSARLGCGVGRRRAALDFPTFPALRNLELTGMLPDDDGAAAIAAVTRILERTPRLETLSLFFLPEHHPAADRSESYVNDLADHETIHAAHKLRYDRHATIAVPEVAICCLRERIREINFVHYQGALAQRMLAKFLLRNAPVVDEVCCEFARGPRGIQTELMEEINGWVLNKSTNMMFF